MKTRISLLVVICLLVGSLSVEARRVSGNKNIVTKVIHIQDYEKIDTGGSIEFIYEESDAAPYLEITVDENILPYIRIDVHNKKLSIWPDKEKNVDLQPTKYQVRTNSTSLSKGSFVGSGTFTLKNLAKSNDVKVNLAGSGKTIVEGVSTNDLNLSMAGSGNIQVNQAKVKKVKGDMAGSGSIKVTGDAESGKFEMAGSGKIDAENCRMKEVRADVAGSGSIYVYVTEELKGEVVGSGTLYYKGSPVHLNTNVVGSGKVTNRN